MRVLGALLISLPFAASHASIGGDFPPLPCDYAVDQAPAISVFGEVPTYVNGSMFHALFGATSKGGGVISVNFGPSITASFGYVGGPQCNIDNADLANDTFKATGAVTVSGDPRSQNRIFSVSGPAEFAALDSHSLATVEDPVELEGDSLGSDWQNNPKHWDFPIPRYFGPAHWPTDANGDLYGMVYIFDPKPAYRIWRLSKSSGKRVVFADIPPSQQFLDLAKPGPAYVHQCLLFTERFIIIPEIPMRMSLPPTFDWKAIQDAWLGNDTDAALVFRVIDKQSGKELASYRTPPAYSWHAITAFEEGGQIHLDMTWLPNGTALDGFTGRRHGGLWWYGQGKYARFSMPSPSLDVSQAYISDKVVVTNLTSVGKPFVSPEFGVVHPGKMWRQRTRYIWGLATSDAHKDTPWLPHAIKVDTMKLDESPLAYTVPDDVRLGGPVYVPRGEDGAAEDDGSLIMLKYNISEPEHTYVVVLNAATMTERATIILPLKPASNIGLHNHYSQYPSEALTFTI